MSVFVSFRKLIYSHNQSSILGSIRDISNTGIGIRTTLYNSICPAQTVAKAPYHIYQGINKFMTNI